ncbi:MAG: carboxypeptidase regulatory-like domain-containing protein [Candidatus Neomarinimicrobiota bacterium]
MNRIINTVIILLIPFTLFSQELGKIAGKVTDEATGEPLAGANILVEETTLGAASDVDGNYTILGMSAGVYTVRCEYIGYRPVRLSNLRVTPGLTTEGNFALTSEALELGMIEVVAERPLVSKNATSSISLVTAEEIATIPVRGTEDIIALLPSVIIQDENVHIRGGRADEVGFYVNGASTVSPLSNENAVYVSQDAIEEIKVLAGGYTAEHGGANAGIVSQELRTGTSNLTYMVDFQTDKFADEGEQFFNTYSYQHQIGSFAIGGPLLTKNIRFFMHGENNSLGDRIRRFTQGFKFEDQVDDNPNNPVHDTVTVVYKDGFTTRNSGDRINLNGTLLFDYSPLKLRLSATYNDRRYYIDGTPILSTLNEREIYDDLTSLLATGKLTYFLTPKTYIDFNGYLFDYKLERGDSYFGHNWHAWYDSTAVAEHTDSSVIYRNAWQPEFNYRINGFTMDRNGAPNDFYRIIDQSYIGGSANFVSQISTHHELKLGVDARKYTVRYFDIAPSVMIYAADPDASVTGYTHYGDPDTEGPDVGEVPVGEWLTFGGVETYGYDIYGNEVNARKVYNRDQDSLSWSGNPKTGQPIFADAPKQPVFMAGYLQDKIEFNDLVINLGLRFDYFDTDDRTLIRPDSVTVDETSAMILDVESEDCQWKDMKPFTEISPRIGFSFPVTDRTVFYLGYGKFIQVTELNNVYWNAYEQSRQIYQGGYYYGNVAVGFGLEPIRTTSYEVGFRQQITPSAAFDITGFYKNVKGLTHIIYQEVTPGSDLGADYMRRINGDFATTKGLEFRLTLRRVKRLAGMLNYTLTDAEGTGSATTAYVGAVYMGSEVPKVVNPLNYSQAHTGAIMLDYRFDKGDGGPLLEQLGANLLVTFSSGHPYTYVYAPAGGQVSAYSAGTDYMIDTRSRQALETIGASVTPWTFNVDLRLDKTISVMGHDVTFYARATNLLNRKNPINVYERTGSAYDDGFLGDPDYSKAFIKAYGGQNYIDMYQAINVENGQAYWGQIGRQLWGHPRQIFFGIRLSRK